MHNLFCLEQRKYGNTSFVNCMLSTDFMIMLGELLNFFYTFMHFVIVQDKQTSVSYHQQGY